MLGWLRYLLVWPVIAAYRRRARRSLRWRLAGYNLATLIAGLATALVLVGGLAAVAAAARNWAEEEPADDARAVAEFLVAAGAVRPGEQLDAEDLRPIQALLSGELPLYREPRGDQFDVRPDRHLQGVQSIAVLSRELPPDGVARDDAAREVIASAEAGVTDLRANSRLREFAGSEGVGAYPLIDAAGERRGVVVVEKAEIQAPQGWAILRAQVRPVVTSVWVGSIVAAVPGLVVAALLAVAAARSVGGRVRAVAGAAEALAEGSLDRRVPVRGEDEVASLSRSFNIMAERLQQAMTALEEERERAVSLLEANRQLVANVSHELRTPVALIRGQVEALEETGGDDPRMTMALREIDRLERLVADLFQLASAEAGALPLEIRDLDVATVVREAVEPLVEVARREAAVLVSLDALGPAPARADADRLTRVVQNIVRNAVRHTPEGGLVRVAVSATESNVAIVVADTGPGIAAEDLPHVFERFYRADRSRGRDGGGAGLGLAIARQFVEAMEGSIDAESVPGEGATFRITFRRGE